MAERLEDYDWSAARRRNSQYPWDEWSDGSIWRITQPDDFKVSGRSMEATLRARARKEERSVLVRIESGVRHKDGDEGDPAVVVFQFVEAKPRPSALGSNLPGMAPVRRGPGRPRKSDA